MEETEKKEELKIEPLDTTKEDVKEEITEESKTRRKYIINKTSKKIIITLIVVFVILIGITLFCLFNKMNTKTYNNIYLGNKNISSMTEIELKNYLQEQNNIIPKNNVIVIQNDEIITDISAEEIDLKIDIQKTLDNVMKFGRDKNILINNINIFIALFKKHIEEIIYEHSEEKLDKITQELRGNIEGRVVDDSYVLDEKTYKLIVTRGVTGNGIDVDTFKQEIIEAIKNEEKEYRLVIEKQPPQQLDLDIVYSKITREAKDAYIDETRNPIKFIAHVVGITFDKEELREILQKEENNKEGAIIEFKLTTIQPEIKVTDLKWNLYEDKLASTITYFTTSTANRASNLKLGLSILEGTVVMPGEIFSFNTTMGDCGLSSRGFKPAAIFKDGKVVTEVGGGICQVSSTLYNSALKANLEIVKRSNHALPVGYVKPSLDATVYYPYVDFKFKNTRNYPIKIKTSYNSSGKMSITIMGTFEDIEYEVILTSKIISTIAPKIQYVNDETLKKDVSQITTKGTKGYTSNAYKTVRLNGKVLSKTFLSEDTYKSTPTVIAVGTKEEAPIVTTPVEPVIETEIKIEPEKATP